MAHLYRIYKLQSNYMDKRSNVSRQEWIKQLESSSTVYVGNLSFYTTEDQVFQLFKECGDIELIVMGLNRMNRAPCGFCFVQYKNHGSAFKAVEILNGSSLDQRQIRVDWDSGKDILNDNRKFGRGVSGGQWRDEFRTSFDPGRGGEGGGMEYIQRKKYKRSRYNDINYWSKYFENPEPAKRIRVATQIKTDVAAEQ